ncbi:MAG: nucleotidyltransferase family protein [Bacteriovoracaceae bacterium]|jgi:predicted nucleotidyltransferase
MIPGLNQMDAKLVQDILIKFKHIYSFSFFGSRVKGTHRPSSDLDLCVYGVDSTNSHSLSELAEKFEDSMLPFKVDIVNFEDCSPDFKSIIKQQEYIISSKELSL